MNEIKEIVKSWTRNDNRKVDSPDQQLQSLIKHPEILAFQRAHPEVTYEEYKRNLVNLHQLVTDVGHCKKCPGLDKCPNMMPGYVPSLGKYAGYLDVRFKPCAKLEAQEAKKTREKFIRSHHIPKEILSAKMEDFNHYDNQMNVLEDVVDFCRKFKGGKRPQYGLYLHGPLGVGKSRMAGAMSNVLVRYKVDSYMVYVPELMREISESIGDNSLHEKLTLLKKASVLILDDIGAEYLTPWKRDEVLGAILQYRMSEQLPTVFTSNLDLNELEKHFTNTNRDPDPMKAKRLMERIRHHVKPLRMEGENWREMKSKKMKLHS